MSPLLRDMFTDDHFAARDRMGRLIVFLARVIQDGNASQVSAIATDEKTAFLMEQDGIGVVAGTGRNVSVYRAHAGGTFNIKELDQYGRSGLQFLGYKWSSRAYARAEVS